MSTLIYILIETYVYLTIADIILSYFPKLKNNVWVKRLNDVTELTQKPIRKLLPSDLPFDFSPVIVIFVLFIILRLW